MLASVRGVWVPCDRRMPPRTTAPRTAVAPCRRATCIWLPLLALAAGGCASVRSKPPQFTDEPLRDTREEVVRPGEAHATITQDGTTVAIVASHACDVWDRPVVTRTTRTESYNRTPAVDWVFLAGGVAIAGVGTYTVIDARNVYATSTNSRTYNPLGSTGATAIGIGTIALGASLLVIPLVDVIRANRVTVDRQEVTTTGTIAQPNVVCKDSPLSTASVEGAIGDKRFPLGSTDATGKLHLDLDTVLDPAWVAPHPPTRMQLVVADATVGDLDLAPLYSSREQLAWNKSDIQRCAAPTTAQACDPARRFIADYPDGPHASEARAALDKGAPDLERLADDDAWTTARPSLEKCSSGKTSDLTTLDHACDAVQAYIDQHPQGRHTREASAAVKRGRATSAAMVAAIDRQQKAAEAAERRREAQAEAAEKRRQEREEAAEKRRQAQAEAAERHRQAQEEAAAHRRCEAACAQQCTFHAIDPVLCIAYCPSRCQ